MRIPWNSNISAQFFSQSNVVYIHSRTNKQWVRIFFIAKQPTINCIIFSGYLHILELHVPQGTETSRHVYKRLSPWSQAGNTLVWFASCGLVCQLWDSSSPPPFADNGNCRFKFFLNLGSWYQGKQNIKQNTDSYTYLGLNVARDCVKGLRY